MTYVYVAINPATNPPCIKIGITDDIDKRMKQLSVGQIRRWESLYEYYYSSRWKSKCVERQLHGAFQSRNCKNTRDCSSREMFFASPHHVDYLITHHHPKFEATRLRNGNISYSCSFNREYYTLDPDDIKKKYKNWINSDDDSVKEYQKLLRYKNNHKELKKHLAEFMGFMDEKVRVGTKISEGEYLKNSNILKKCYDTINLG